MSELRPLTLPSHPTTSAALTRSEDPPLPTAIDQPTGLFCVFGIQPCTNSRAATNHDVEEEVVHTRGSGPSVDDILAFIGISIMLIWPWIFFGVVWAKKGIQMNNHITEVIIHNLHATTYFITLICSIISMIISALFSHSIVRFAQELVTHRAPTSPFILSVLLAFRHLNWPWGKNVKAAKYLMSKKRWWPALLLIICLLTFPHLISSTTSLLTPAPFNRTAGLTGTKLDFSSSDIDCLTWFASNPISNNCSWEVSLFETPQDTSLIACVYQSYNGMQYTNCLGESQMVDALESGRGSVSEKSILKHKMSVNSVLSRRFLN